MVCGEVPAMAGEVFCVVLALAVHMVNGFGEDARAVLACPLAMSVSIFDTNLRDVRVVGLDVAFGNGDAPVTGLHLNAVVGDAQTDGESKGGSEPVAAAPGSG